MLNTTQGINSLEGSDVRVVTQEPSHVVVVNKVA
jgi:hypothetical protein